MSLGIPLGASAGLMTYKSLKIYPHLILLIILFVILFGIIILYSNIFKNSSDFVTLYLTVTKYKVFNILIKKMQ